LKENSCRIYVLKCAQEKKERLSEAMRGMPTRKVLRIEAGMASDFLVVLGVLVAVKSPVRTSVVVVTVYVPVLGEPAAGVAEVEGELQSEDAL
jgi:hypothetical protein